MKDHIHNDAEVLRSYADYEREITLKHLRVGCYMVMTLMPVGVVLDYFVYPDKLGYFFKLRLLSLVFAGAVWGVLRTWIGKEFHYFLSLMIAVIPAFFICWMIYATEGPASPYYAGLNLVLLAIALVMRWTVGLSIAGSLSVIAMYVGSCLLRGPLSSAHFAALVNNLYFLALTGVIVVAGGRLHRTLRIREFTLRFELDKNKQALEQSNQKLDSQNKELADTLQKLTEAESQLVQQEKMASLGVMSAGIIHEINNPLNFATTGLYTLRKKGKYVAPEQKAEFEDIVKDIEDGVSRVKNIVSDLRMFTHPGTDDLDEFEVSEAVTSALRFLSNEWKDKVHIEQKLPEHQTVRANKTKLIHVLTNLLQNSLDAMREKSFNGEQPTIWIEGRVERGASILTLRDNGPGIKSEHLGKISDPFFTTKDVGAGMGLGLSICYRIVQESNGKISVRTEPGKFCEFTLEFPVKE